MAAVALVVVGGVLAVCQFLSPLETLEERQKALLDLSMLSGGVAGGAIMTLGPPSDEKFLAEAADAHRLLRATIAVLRRLPRQGG